MTDTTTTLLRQTEARQAEREEWENAHHSCILQEWRCNPGDCARRTLMDAGLQDERLIESITHLALTDSELRSTLQWFEVDQRMGEDDG